MRIMSSEEISVKKEDLNPKEIKKGFLYVKLALNLGTFVGQYKFWSRKWIEFEYIGDEKSGHFVDILVYKNKRSETIIYRKSFQSKNTAIFRSRSRTKSYSFTICDNNVAIIHLSADSETESQQWMQILRNTLWPPNPLMEFENSIKGHFYASIIDNENSHRSGLLGAYGYLQLSNANLVLTHPQTGHVIQEWLLSQNSLKNPFENILQIVKKSSSFSGLQNIFIYSKDTNRIMQRIIHINQINLINYQENRVKCRNQLEKLSLNGSTHSSIISKEFSNIFDRNIQTLNTMKCNSIDCNFNTFRIRSQTEIPESMLNCSLSSNYFTPDKCHHMENIYSEPSDPFDYIESDIYEDIDRIYEEIATNYDNNIDINDYFGDNSDPNKIVSDSIDIKFNGFYLRNNKEENQMFGYDMFSKIVKQSNISLIDSKLLNKRSHISEDGSDTDYCEMKPIFGRKSTDGSNKSLDESEYIYMKSFSI